MRKLTSLSLLLAIGTGCATFRTIAYSDSARRALVATEAGANDKPTPDAVGRAALTIWLISSDPAKTDYWIARALKADPNEPYALFTRLLMARERMDDHGEAEAALAILKGAPASPLAEMAAYRLREVVAQSPAVDREIHDGLAPLLSGSLGLNGPAALRSREVLVALDDARNDDAEAAAGRAAIGTVTAWTVVGPIHAFRLRDFNKPSAFDDPKHTLSGRYASVLGSVAPREFDTPEGGLDLSPDTWRAEIYEALTDVTAKAGGDYQLSLRGAGEARVYVDGVQVAERLPLPMRPPDRTWASFRLSAGAHRLRVRFARVDVGWIQLLLPRADGAPSDLSFAAPHTFAPPPAPAVRAEKISPAAADGSTGGAASGAPAGLPVAYFLDVERLLMDRPDEARAELPALVSAAGESPTVRALRADLLTGDPDLPRANTLAKLMLDLNAILLANPTDARALFGRMEEERNEKHYEDASALMKRLIGIVGETQPHVLVERAHMALDRGNTAEARRLTDAALAADPDRCEALAFRVDLARHDAEIATTAALLPRLLACPGGIGAYVGFLRAKMRIADTIPYLRQLLARNPFSTAARRALADAQYATGKQEEATRTLVPLVKQWPDETDAFKRLASYRELSGAVDGAREMLDRAREVQPGDLGLDRAIAVEDHEEILGWAARDGLAAIEGFRKSGFHSDAPAIQVLDFGALEVQPDGSSLERVQSVVQVLDKRGIDQYGEVSIPSDAIALTLRTIKSDGRILDAEAVSGKDTISMPNLEPGDFVEYGFVRANSPRQASMKGWSGGQFIFQADDIPFFESTYVVRAPASVGMELDSDHIDPPPKIEKSGSWLTFTWTNRLAEPYQPAHEPFSPTDTELLPWVELGAGAGNEAFVAQAADYLPLHTRLSQPVLDFVRGCESLPVEERVRKIVDRIRMEIQGESNSLDFNDAVATTIYRGRGNRMLLLKTALAAAGIPSHVVFARPYSANQHHFRFPNGSIAQAALLRIEPPGSAPLWMDFTLRAAPLGAIPAILSGQDAYIVPNDPREDVEAITLPVVNPEADRSETTMDLHLDPAGTLTGTVVQKAYGFDAAAFRYRLEQTNTTELRKAQERALSRAFRGLTLTDFQVKDTGNPDDPIEVISVLKVPGYTNRGGGNRGLAANFGPLYLGPRFVSRAERKTPLLLSTDDMTRARATLTLPQGTKLAAPDDVDLETPFGSYKAMWKLNGLTLSMDEQVVLKRGRIPRADYPAFQAFATGVDEAQNREISFDGPAAGLTSR